MIKNVVIKMNKGVSSIIALLFMSLIFIGIGITTFPMLVENYKNDPLPIEISKLPEMNLEDVKTYEQYKDFTDKINALILILNKQEGFDIPLLETTQEAWSEISKKINKYGPLINDYRELIRSAKKFKNNKTEENYKKFYLNLGKFSLEITLISVTLFHEATFQTVGYVYRASGFNIWAFKCPSCVSAVLSSVYWSIKTVLVEESSKIVEKLLTEFKNLTKNKTNNLR